MAGWDAGRIEREIALLDRRSLPPYDLRVAAMERLSEAMPIDGWCFATADPESLVMTSHARMGLDRSGTPLIDLNEYAQRDVGKHDRLAGARWPVSVLSQATRGERERSPRYRGVLRPMGIEHELRAAVRERDETWGFLHILRHIGRRDFDADEAALVERFARCVAPALRRSLLGEAAAPSPATAPPAVILMDARNRPVEGTTEGGWARDLRDEEAAEGALPEVFVTLAIRARSLLAQGPDAVARARVRGVDGTWYSAAALCTDRDRVAIVLQPAQPAELVRLILSHHRFTPAEAQIARLVLAGRSTRAIADELVVSPHTVQDHLKSVFAKVGVRSRRDLVARLTGASA